MPEQALQGEIVLYRTGDGQTRIECRFVDESIWLSQRLMGELFQVSVKTVNEHLKNIYKDGELASDATIRKFRIVQTEGSRQISREVGHYNLEAILAADYDPSDEEPQRLFQTFQNKLHCAVTGKTAPELIHRTCRPYAAEADSSAEEGALRSPTEIAGRLPERK